MAVNETQQYASVQFSDPIAVGQDLTGLITLSDQSEITYTINGSEVKVFGTGKLDGNFTSFVNVCVGFTIIKSLNVSGITGSLFKLNCCKL